MQHLLKELKRETGQLDRFIFAYSPAHYQSWVEKVYLSNNGDLNNLDASTTLFHPYAHFPWSRSPAAVGFVPASPKMSIMWRRSARRHQSITMEKH